MRCETISNQCMMNIFQSTKVIELGSCAFRQWRASHSHCRFLHGYRLMAKFWFECSELDDKNWATDFGGLKELKASLQQQFDHTTCVASDDPALSSFEKLHSDGVIDLRVMDGVGAERTAQWVYEAASKFILENYGDRCWVSKVEVFEHEDNSAVYRMPPTPAKVDTGNIQPLEPTVTHQVESIEAQEPQYNKHDTSAPVGRQSTPGLKGLFDGTIWG